MPRRRGTRSLNAWVNGRLAARWRIAARGDMEFQYERSWIESPEGRPFSLSLPFTLDNLPIKGRAVECYFDNLLPDSDVIRRRIQDRFHTSSRSPFDLLAAIGRDCVGAVQLLPGDEVPDIQRVDAHPLTEAEIEAELNGVVSPASFARHSAEDDFRISLAGAQEKTALLLHEGQWCRPRGATPTTHIFKLPLGRVGRTSIDMSTSVENEWLCSKIIAAYGLPIADCEMGSFGARKALVVKRFDRQLHSSGRYWLRLMQEDFCQATATPPSRKYEADGGPGMAEISRIVRGSAERDRDLTHLVKAQLLFWMLAAIDGHAKNFSLRTLPGGHYELTPLYDVLSAWPVIGGGADRMPWEKAKLAMAVTGKNKHYLLKDIQRRHFNEMAMRCGLGRDAELILQEVIEATPEVISAVQRAVPASFPQQVIDAILTGLLESAKRLEAMPRGV
jgi:serine/threonine-protein kinase HipA